MKNVFITGGVSYNSVITIENFPGAKSQTIHHCRHIETIGNTGAGKSLALSRIGFDVTLHSLIGDDQYGSEIRRHLKSEKLKFKPEIDSSGTARLKRSAQSPQSYFPCSVGSWQTFLPFQ